MRSVFQRGGIVIVACLLLAACSASTGGAAPTVTPPPTLTSASGGLPTRPTATTQSLAEATAPPSDSQPTATAQAAVPPTDAPSGPAGYARKLQVDDPRLEGDDVKVVQDRLLELGYRQNGENDGVFDEQTGAEVEQFQAANGLEVDGIVGPLTWEALFSQAALPHQPSPTDSTATGRIVFLKSDNVTLASVKPDGSDEQIFYETGLEGTDEVSSLSLDPSRSFIAYTYGDQPNLTIITLDGTVVAGYEGLGAPIWSPDGSYFLSNALPPSGDPKMVMYVTENSDGAGPIGEFPALGAAWLGDGKQIVYSDGSNIWIYYTDDGSSSQLTEFPREGDDAWYIQHVEFSPDGASIFFFGGASINLGASGNGMQWWMIPSGGGELIPFREPGGNGIGDFAYNPDGSLMAYSEGFHVSACITGEGITAIEPGASEGGFAPAINDAPQDGGMYVRGLAWAPDGSQLAYGTIGYHCDETGLEFQPPTLYVWAPEASVGTPIAEGTFPVWLAD